MRLSTVIAATALLTPAPALASLWDGPGGDMPRAREIGPVSFQSARSETPHKLDSAIDALRERRKSGDISREEYRQLKREARLIARLEDRYAFDGLSLGERSKLEFRSRHLLDVAANRTVRP